MKDTKKRTSKLAKERTEALFACIDSGNEEYYDEQRLELLQLAKSIIKKIRRG